MTTNATRYTAQAATFEIIDGEGDKAPQVKVELRVVEGPDTGRTLYYYGSLHENAAEYTAQALRAMGWNCNDITALTGLGSLKVVAVEKIGEYKGKPTRSWMIFPVKTPRPVLEADAKAGFAARYKALAAAVPAVPVTALNAAGELPPAQPRNGTSTGPTTAPTTGGPISF